MTEPIVIELGASAIWVSPETQMGIKVGSN
jgi:hypothetical protein